MALDRKPPTKNIPAKAAGRSALFASDRLTSELAQLKQQLRDNERIWGGFHRIELALIGAHSLRELVSVIVSELPRTFPRVDCVSLACFDPEYEMARLLGRGEGATDGVTAVESFISISQESLQRLFGDSRRPRLDVSDRDTQALLFPTYPRPLGSFALAPLVLRGQLIGALNQGSIDTGHFTPDVATDLLEHLAAVTAMCIDNAVHHERLRVYSFVDPLTEVANRRFFERRLNEEIERWLRRREPLVYMLADIDHFKAVNDQYGHQVGDQVLQQVAALLGRDLRGVDLLARYGGEEFMLLLPNTTVEQGAAIARRLCHSVAHHPFAISGQRSIPVTVSIGVACLDVPTNDAATPLAARLFEQADGALYSAKQSGRNRVAVAASEMTSDAK
ncbi:MAG: sensor domain-containing diguanylate cyclase [Gammaproteobacteria bacterium]|nr:sensor domain-containing diguanylate cyclase [Gammaproteobacteria bacterium]